MRTLGCECEVLTPTQLLLGIGPGLTGNPEVIGSPVGLVPTNALVLTGLAKIWVQLGCNNSSRGFRKAPRVAIGAVKLQLVTSGCCTVTAEVASSSLVVPAILSKGVIGRDTENSNPQLNPQLLIHRGTHPHRVQEFALRGPCFVAVLLRVQIERGLNLAMTQDSLNGFWFDFRLVHQPVA
jgi:hypothetical protein